MNTEMQPSVPQTIVGLDPGSRIIGAARMYPGSGAIITRSLKWADDPGVITDRIAGAIGIERPALVVVEHQFQRGYNVIGTAQAAGALAWWARTQWPGVPVVWMLANEARRTVGCGNKKTDVLPWILSGGHAGLVIDHPGDTAEDAHDAAVLAAAGAVLARHNGWIH